MDHKIEIYIATHKKFNLPKNDIYLPIQAGSAINEGLGYCNDNVGDNISYKNKSYCELTILYWIWKNSNANIVGLCHYRRYFTKKVFSRDICNILDKDDILNILNKFDIILPKKDCLYGTTEKHYSYYHYNKDLQEVRNIIKEKFPSYLNSFEKVMQQDYIYTCNMFICKKEIIDKYCEWLFDILGKLEKRIDISNYNVQQKRIYGFMSERLFNVWIDYNNYKIYTVRKMNTEETLEDKKLELKKYISYKILKKDMYKK